MTRRSAYQHTPLFAVREARDIGMLFSGRMVRAIIRGTKRQTRRIVQLPRGYELDGIRTGDAFTPAAVLCSRPNMPTGERAIVRFAKGDRLWVRETFALIWPGESPPERREDNRVEYKADTSARYPGEWPDDAGDDPDCPRWQSPLHMPRWACRLELVLDEVRVQRLQSIDCGDIRAEGVMCPEHDDAENYCEGECAWMRKAFSALWDGLGRRPTQLHGNNAEARAAAMSGTPQRYADNPLVWALSFHIVKGPAR